MSVGAAAIASAFVTSLCCIGPLVVGVLGVGSAAAFARFERYRRPLSVVAVALLTLAFYFARAKPISPGECGCEPTHGSSTRRMLLLSMFAVVTLLTLPALSTRLLGDHTARGVVAGDRVAIIAVEGMSCASCAVGIRRALLQISGVDDVQVDLDRRSLSVRYRGGMTSPAAIIAAVSQVGYPAKLSGDGR